MFHDARALPDGSTLTADVAIVGAGAAGITVALELAGRGLRVALVESGGLEDDAATQALYEGTRAADTSSRTDRCRVRRFGGTTSRWAGWCRPLDAVDFEERPNLPGSAWPIGLHDLDPHYARAHEILEVEDTDYDAASMARHAGASLLPLGEDSGLETVLFRFSPPTRMGDRYRRRLTTARDVDVYLWSNLRDITVSDAGGSVTRLDLATLSGRAHSLTARAYVLACGGIENSRLLLAAGERRPIGTGHGNVGRYFMEHPHVPAGIVMLPDAGSVDRVYGLGGKSRAIAVVASTETSRRAGAPAFNVWLRRPEEEVDDPLVVEVRDAAAALRGSASAPLEPFELTLRSEPTPTRDSRITLGGRTDALGVPRAHVAFRLADGDRERLRGAIATVARGVGATGRVRTRLAGSASTWPRVGGGCHHLGGTRMSPSPKDGVVDADCRVHGVDNLFVAGSSVFRTGGHANPTLTIVALASRLAGHLRRVLR